MRSAFLTNFFFFAIINTIKNYLRQWVFRDNAKGAVCFAPFFEVAMRIENDREIFEAGYPGIVPFLIEEYKGEVSVEVYEGAEAAAREYLARHEGRLFSKEALSHLARSLDGYLLQNRYERDTVGETLYYYQYEMTDRTALDPSLVKAGTYRLTASLIRRVKKNLTTFTLDELLSKKLEAFVVVEDDAVVAIAAVNERLEKGKVLEITVETSPRFRQRGYALSTVTALSDYLLDKGATVAYCCRNTHMKSNRVAKRVGFTRVGRFYAVSAYRLPDSDKE